jgi:arsenate reductase
MKIYHNPRCQKSRETLKIIKESGKDIEIIKYLEQVPSESELKEILEKLKIPVKDVLRKEEKIFKEYYRGISLSEDDWIKVMVKHPKLIQRPIVIKGDKAVLGRPPKNVKQLL